MLLESGILTVSTVGMLQYLSSRGGIVRYYACIGLFLVAMLLCSIWGLLVTIPMSLVGRRYDIEWLVARTFYELAHRLLGIRLTLEGAEYLDTNPAMYIGNHQSMIDILYLAKMFPKRCSVMAKKSLKFSPLLGQWMWLSGAVFINRGNSKQAMESLQKAGQDMKDRSISLWIFPEGTRTLFETPGLLPFKKGAFHVAVQAGVPIVPVVCENYWRLYHKGVFAAGELKIKVLPPIPTTGLTAADVTQLSTDTRELMLKTLREISVPVSKEVEEADNAALARISKQPLSPQVVAAAPDVAPVAPPPEIPAPAAPASSSHDASASVSSSDGSGERLEDPSRDRKLSLSQTSSAEDDEMVIVDRPTPSS